MSATNTPAQRGTGRPITPANARTMAQKSAETKRRKRVEREERARELAALASLSPRERLRLELAQDADQLVAVLRRALRSDNDQVALKAAVAWLAEAHGKPAATHRIETPARLLPHTMGELEAELAALEREYGQEALGSPE